MPARSFLGAGDVYINRIVNGVKQGLKGPFYADAFSIQPNVEVRQSTSKGRNDYGQVLESVSLQQPADFSLALKEVSGDALIMAFLGTETALNQVSGTMADQAFTVTAKDVWLDLGHLNLGSAIVIENQAGTTTYVEGTDYRLNRPMGWVKILPGSAIALNANLTASGPYAAAAGSVISGATRAEVRAEIIFDGINKADNSQVKVLVREAVIAPESEFDFLADDFGNVELTGTLKTPPGFNEPFTVTVQPTA